MVVFVSVVLALAALFAVAYPLLSGSRTSAVPAGNQESLLELLLQRDAAFQALRDLQYDQEVGKIGAEDFSIFNAHLRQIAADALRQIDAWEASARQQLRHVMDTRSGATLQPGSVTGQACGACGAPLRVSDEFCTACGVATRHARAATAASAATTCAQCGSSLRQEDLYCSKCGQPARVTR